MVDADSDNQEAAMTTFTSPRFQWRAFTSVLLALGFVILAISGTVLFLSPPGRVANWTNWTILGLRKSDWSALHVWFSATFLAMTAVHLLLNWRPMLGYFRDRVSRRLSGRREWALAGVVCVGVFVGIRAEVPPFSSLLAWNEKIKESWDRPAQRAPLPHAELLTLRALAEQARLDATTAVGRLQAAGITPISLDATVQSIASARNISAQQVYSILTAQPVAEEPTMGAPTGGGTGWKTLRQFCTDEGIDYEKARGRLSARGITPDEAATLRELAAKHGQKPYDLVALIRAER
jgi:hypothetical protein